MAVPLPAGSFVIQHFPGTWCPRVLGSGGSVLKRSSVVAPGGDCPAEPFPRGSSILHSCGLVSSWCAGASQSLISNPSSSLAHAHLSSSPRVPAHAGTQVLQASQMLLPELVSPLPPHSNPLLFFSSPTVGPPPAPPCLPGHWLLLLCPSPHHTSS